MRNKALLLALTVVVACGAGPMRGAVPASNQVVLGQAQPYAVAQIAFKGSEGMKIEWNTTQFGVFDGAIVCKDAKPVFQNFQTAHSYRLKISNVPNREGLTLYPTLTVNAVTPRTRAYLDHNAIPVKFTENDFDQVQNGNFVTKVIFLPAPTRSSKPRTAALFWRSFRLETKTSRSRAPTTLGLSPPSSRANRSRSLALTLPPGELPRLRARTI